MVKYILLRFAELYFLNKLIWRYRVHAQILRHGVWSDYGISLYGKYILFRFAVLYIYK